MNNKQQHERESNKPQQENPSNTVKNPDDWTTGSEEMTGAQRSYLQTLSQEAGEELNEDLTKAEASKKIDELQHKTGRGLDR
jgi:glucose-6-phosphate isomerase